MQRAKRDDADQQAPGLCKNVNESNPEVLSLYRYLLCLSLAATSIY